MPFHKDPNRLEVYLESRKRRIYVGTLEYKEKKDLFEFTYDPKYVKSPKAIPVGPDLDLFKIKHQSMKGRLFPSFADRIPSRSNPAYAEYCRSQGISVDERNPIVLLGTIGRRGPSSFIFEQATVDNFTFLDILRFRKRTNISRHDMAAVFQLSVPTLQRIETAKSEDANTMKLIQIYLEFPEVALWQIQKQRHRVSNDTAERLIEYFRQSYQAKKAANSEHHRH